MSEFKEIKEGECKISIPSGKVTRKLPGFYNPAMKANRDITVALLKTIGKGLNVALPLAATGIRAIRLRKETDVGNITANDISESAFKLMKKNLKKNKIDFFENKFPDKLKIDKGVHIFNKDANQFLLESKGYHFIDIDPFGSPNPFLNSSVDRISRNGILAITATDTSSLAGTHPKAGMRKYWAKTIKTELMHEMALRILIRKIQLVGAQFDKALIPIYSYAKEHYYRVFFRCEKGKIKTDRIMDQHGYITFCKTCASFEIGKIPKEKCPRCEGKTEYSGPMWLGLLWSEAIAININNVIDDVILEKFTERIMIESSIPSPFFYDIHVLSKLLKTKQVKSMEDVIKKIEAFGHKASRTHFSEYGIRTDIPYKRLIRILDKE